MTSSSIEWTDRSDWNPVRGCSRVSPGCGGPGDHGGCYAESMAARFSKPGMWGHGFAEMQGGKPRWTGKVELQEDRLLIPLSWRKPAKVFPNSTSDFFHEALPDSDIDKLFAAMALCPHLTFQIPTKRAERMQQYICDQGCDLPDRSAGDGPRSGTWTRVALLAMSLDRDRFLAAKPKWPLPNVWLGVSAEDQDRWDERKDHLRNTPAVIRFASFEPLLGGIVEPRPMLDFIHWAIIGGESGPKARDNWIPNVRALIKQCQKAGVAVFNKQLGSNVQDRDDAGFDGCEPTEWPAMDYGRIEYSPNGCLDEGYQGAPVRVHLKDRKGGDWSEWPEDLRVREFPQVRG